ncbi:MAG: endonuclease/exonuclease/phosphatase family protein [Myxococcota bacterium]
MRLVSWNVRYFSQGARGLWATLDQVERVAGALAALDPVPDVLALQELENGSLRGGARPQLELFLEAFERALAARGHPGGFVGTYFPAHRYTLGDTSLYTTGLAVVCAPALAPEPLGVTEITHVRLPAFAPLKQRRIAARVRLRPPGWARPVVLCNTHLSLPAFLEVGPHRVPRRMGCGSNQLAEIERVLAAVDLAEPTVIAGDFNSAPGSPVHARVLARGWATADPGGPTARFLHHQMHLDHLFASPSVRLADVRTGPRALADLSDHAPVFATLGLT